MMLIPVKCPSRVWIAVAVLIGCPQIAFAAGVVTVCNEAAFKAAVFGGGLVSFACSGTITLSGGQVKPLSDTTISGSGQKVTLSGGGKNKIFDVRGVILRLSDLTLADGLGQDYPDSGAILVENGRLSVVRIVFRRNTVTDTRRLSCGGAIVSIDSRTDVTESTFTGNSADLGGAICNKGSGDTSVDKSTFSGNSADTGGAIFQSANLAVYNCTFYGNGSPTARGGAIYLLGDGFVNLTSNTFFGGVAPNGGGNIFNGGPAGPVVLRNNILGGGFKLPFPGSVASLNCYGSFTDGGGNLRWPPGDPTCLGSYGDPKLGPLANNYGPTQTVALMPGSAAIDTAFDLVCPSTDQRGILRPVGPHCDIGAYEAIPSLIAILQTFASTVGNFKLRHPEAGGSKLAQQVIGPLSRSLDATLWQPDGNHLNAERGEQVFDLHRTAINNLAELIADQTQLDYIGSLLFADRGLAAAAMSAANCGAVGAPSPANGKCAKAASELAKGDSSRDAGNYGDASDHYKSAWSDVVSPSSHD